MTKYWLTPLNGPSPIILGAERLPLPADLRFNEFRRKLQEIQPRLLLMFKANMLLGEEEDEDEAEACGEGQAELPLASGCDMELGVPGRPLSHCAEAFIDRLPPLPQAKLWLEQAIGSGNWTPQESEWLEWIGGWVGQGWQVILLRED